VTRPSATALRRALLTLTGIAAVLLPIAAAAPSARAVDAPVVTVQLTSIEARGTKPKHRVILKATITNTGTVPAYGVQAMLWRSRDPITNLPTLREVAAGSSAWGSAMMGVDQYRLITLSTVPFAPGETRTVRLRATLAELGFDARGAAYTIGVQVIGTGDQSSNYVVIGEDRTLLPLPEADPVPITSLVALNAPPSKLVDDLFADESLAAALTGRLDVLLRAAEAGRGYLVDTCLLDEVADMADGYQVRSGDAEVPGTGVTVARDWLARLQRLPSSSGARTLFASPDVLGAQQAGNTDALGWAEAATDEVEILDDLPLVALPASGVLTQDGYAALAAADIEGVVATNGVRAGAWQSGAAGVGVVSASATLAAAETTPTLDQQQQLQAEAVIAGRAGQVRLITDPSQLGLDAATTTDWMVGRDISDLLDSKPATRQAALLPAEPAVLGGEAFSGAARLERDFAAYGELVPDSDVISQAAGVLARSVSSGWISNDRGQADHVRTIGERIGAPALARQVSLDASSRFVMSAKRNEFPVTITNDLGEAIRVKVRVTTDNPQRISVPDSDVVTVEPGQSQTVNIRPQAESNGVTAARAWLATENGTRITPDTAITIEVTDLGMIGWVIVVGSGGVVLGATALRVRQVRRRAPASQPPPNPTVASQPTVVPSEPVPSEPVPSEPVPSEPAPSEPAERTDG
jgi:hypothetical protein